MSLFERIQKRIIIESSSDTTGQNKKNKKKEFSSNISRTVKVSKDTEGLGSRQSRLDATDPKQGGYSRVDDTIDAETPSGKRKLTDTTKGGKVKTYNVNKKNRPLRKGVDYFFDAEKAKKERDAFQQGRKAYTDSKTGIKAGKPTKQGIINYIAKARDKRQGTNANTKANKKAAEIIYKSSGSEYAEKIRKKYETDKNLPRKRPSNAKSLEQIKKEIDSRPPDGRTTKTKTKVKTPPPYKRIETKVTDKEIQDLIKKGKEAIPKKSTKVTAAKLANVDKAIKNLDDLIIGGKPGEKAFIKKALRKQQRVVTKKITTPSKKEIEQSQKILDKAKNKPKVTKVKGNLFDPTGKIADQTKKANQSFKDFLRKLKTKHPKPKLSLYDPLKNKIPNLEPLKPLKKPFIKPSTTTKTATKSKALLPKLMKAVRKKPKGVVGLGLVALGTYGAIKNRIKTKTKTPPPNKNLVPLPNKDKVKIVPVPQVFNIVGDSNAKNDTFRKR